MDPGSPPARGNFPQNVTCCRMSFSAKINCRVRSYWMYEISAQGVVISSIWFHRCNSSLSPHPSVRRRHGCDRFSDMPPANEQRRRWPIHRSISSVPDGPAMTAGTCHGFHTPWCHRVGRSRQAAAALLIAEQRRHVAVKIGRYLSATLYRYV